METGDGDRTDNDASLAAPAKWRRSRAAHGTLDALGYTLEIAPEKLSCRALRPDRPLASSAPLGPHLPSHPILQFYRADYSRLEAEGRDFADDGTPSLAQRPELQCGQWPPVIIGPILEHLDDFGRAAMCKPGVQPLGFPVASALGVYGPSLRDDSPGPRPFVIVGIGPRPAPSACVHRPRLLSTARLPRLG